MPAKASSQLNSHAPPGSLRRCYILYTSRCAQEPAGCTALHREEGDSYTGGRSPLHGCRDGTPSESQWPLDCCHSYQEALCEQSLRCAKCFEKAWRDGPSNFDSLADCPIRRGHPFLSEIQNGAAGVVSFLQSWRNSINGAKCSEDK